MTIIRKTIAILIAIFLFIPAAADASDRAVTESFILIPEAEQRLRYDCTYFRNDWPENIRTEMTERFKEDQVISGVYFQFGSYLINEPVPIVFAACSFNGQKKLVGAWYFKDQWSAQIISDHFFRREQEFNIVMKPDLNMAGRIISYKPAVQYNGEWFAFTATGRGFLFAYYEREKIPDDDMSGDVRTVVEIGNRDINGKDEKCFIVSSHWIGHEWTETYCGKILDTFDTDMIDAATFPRTLEEVWECCEPNG